MTSVFDPKKQDQKIEQTQISNSQIFNNFHFIYFYFNFPIPLFKKLDKNFISFVFNKFILNE